jgi:CheY-like chemotaxis protein
MISMTRKYQTIFYKASAIPMKFSFMPAAMRHWNTLTGVDTQPFLILSDIDMPKINGFEPRN